MPALKASRKGVYQLAEDTRANQKAEGKTQQEPMPSSEQQATESAEPESVASTEGLGEAEQVEAEEELQLPEDASERTQEQFEKLKTQNKRLKEELEKKKQTESVFESMRPKPQPALEPMGVQQQSLPEYIDPDTGYIDVPKFNQALSQTRAEAQQARQQVRQYIEDQQEREAYTAHPELNPQGESFNEKLYRDTKAHLLSSMIYPKEYGGKSLTLREAADLAKGEAGEAIAEAEKRGAKEAVEGLSPKEQASLEATGRSDRRTQASATLDELRIRTRYGDRGAVAERLKSIPATPATPVVK